MEASEVYESEKPRILVLCGPTASGKSACAVALAKQIDGEIVSADSMQIYRGMDIGTAKPTSGERGGITHHMLDVTDPDVHYSAAQYAQEADACIRDILSRKKTPILCGGTGLYIDAVTKPYRFSKKGDEALRAELLRQAEQPGGKEALHARLREVDPEAAARLHLNDVRRVVRAIEIHRLTGKTQSESMAEDAKREDRYLVNAFALHWPREVLYDRIDRRVDQMMKEGLIEEVRCLAASDAFRASTALQALGYKEIVEYLDGRMALDDAVERIKRRSRNYAKRQLTWFRRDEKVRWIPAEGRDMEDISREIIRGMEKPEEGMGECEHELSK